MFWFNLKKNSNACFEKLWRHKFRGNLCKIDDGCMCAGRKQVVCCVLARMLLVLSSERRRDILFLLVAVQVITHIIIMIYPYLCQESLLTALLLCLLSDET